MMTTSSAHSRLSPRFPRRRRHSRSSASRCFRGRRAAGSLGPAHPPPVAPSADPLDSWLVIGRDERVTVFTGKVELGTGVSTALRQIVAEELDVALRSHHVGAGRQRSHGRSGSTVGSGSVKRGGAQLRRAAAEARWRCSRWRRRSSALRRVARRHRRRRSPSLATRPGRVTFGELIGGKRFERAISGTTRPVKAPTAYASSGNRCRASSCRRR